MRVHHINCGTMCPLGRRLVNGDGSVFARGRMVCHCLLIETRGGLALVDTGLGTQDVAAPRARLGRGFRLFSGARLSRDETALAHVQRLGYSARDVRHLLPTHLDLDHAGGLSDFPDARVHLFEREHDAATRPATWRERARYREPQWSHGPKWERHAPAGGETWFGFEAVRPLPGTEDEILIVPLVGHTRGHAGIAVKSERGWLLHAGDAYFFHGEIDPVNPRSTPGLAFFQRHVAVDDAARLRNQARLRELARSHAGEVRIFSAHCPVEYDRLYDSATAAHPVASAAHRGEKKSESRRANRVPRTRLKNPT